MDNIVALGEFEVKSGKVYVSDPCYDPGTWCQGVLENVKNGTWQAQVEKSDEGIWGIRCASLIVFHKDFAHYANMTSKACDFVVGVDSGQAGVFDFAVYKDDESAKGKSNFIEDEPWYSTCCDQTLSDQQAGVIEGGAVSSSGYGDGLYTAYYAIDANKEVVAIKIVFMEDEATCNDCGEYESSCTCDYCETCSQHIDNCECDEFDDEDEENNEG